MFKFNHANQLRLCLSLVGVIIWLLALAAVWIQAKNGNIRRNDEKAFEILARIQRQQEVFKGHGVVDQDGDGKGEYGLLSELTGENQPRGGKAVKLPQYLPPDFRCGGADGDGVAEWGGYCYRVYLPSDRFTGGDDTVLGGKRGQPGITVNDTFVIDLQEEHYVCYAWPSTPGRSGTLCMLIRAEVPIEVYLTRMKHTIYSGPKGGPDLEAAFGRAAFLGHSSIFLGPTAEGQLGMDRNEWYVTTSIYHGTVKPWGAKPGRPSER